MADESEVASSVEGELNTGRSDTTLDPEQTLSEPFDTGRTDTTENDADPIDTERTIDSLATDNAESLDTSRTNDTDLDAETPRSEESENLNTSRTFEQEDGDSLDTSRTEATTADNLETDRTEKSNIIDTNRSRETSDIETEDLSPSDTERTADIELIDTARSDNVSDIIIEDDGFTDTARTEETADSLDTGRAEDTDLMEAVFTDESSESTFTLEVNDSHGDEIDSSRSIDDVPETSRTEWDVLDSSQSQGTVLEDSTSNEEASQSILSTERKSDDDSVHEEKNTSCESQKEPESEVSIKEEPSVVPEDPQPSSQQRKSLKISLVDNLVPSPSAEESSSTTAMLYPTPPKPTRPSRDTVPQQQNLLQSPSKQQRHLVEKPSPVFQCQGVPPSELSSQRDTRGPNAIVAFDVGGKIFRCKASLIRQHPKKRLNQVIACGCESICKNVYFVDRNPEYFENILDWYRTGNPYSSRENVHLSKLKDDAKYFDVIEELFPPVSSSPVKPEQQPQPPNHASVVPPPRPPRPSRIVVEEQEPTAPTVVAQRPNSPSRTRPPVATSIPDQRTQQNNPPHTVPEVEEKKRKTDENRVEEEEKVSVSAPIVSSSPSKPMVFAKKQTLKLYAPCQNLPVVYVLRSNEQLLLESVQGIGKLVVSVSDEKGNVYVPQAILFDSNSVFFLNGAKAPLQHCLLPGNYIYTFWHEPYEVPVPAVLSASTVAIVAPSSLVDKGKSSRTCSSNTGKTLKTSAAAKGTAKGGNGKLGSKAIKDAKGAQSEPVKPKEICLEVDFKLIYTFGEDDQLAEGQIPSLLSGTVGNYQQGAFVPNTAAMSSVSSGTGETLKWFPPFYQTLPKQANEQAVEPLTKQESPQQPQASVSQLAGQQSSSNGQKEIKQNKPEAGGKVTVYQPTKLQPHQPQQPSPHGAAAAASNPTSNPTTRYQEHQPRKFK